MAQEKNEVFEPKDRVSCIDDAYGLVHGTVIAVTQEDVVIKWDDISVPCEHPRKMMDGIVNETKKSQ